MPDGIWLGVNPRGVLHQNMPASSEQKYEYQTSSRFFAQTADGLEEIAAAELLRIGARLMTLLKRSRISGMFFSSL